MAKQKVIGFFNFHISADKAVDFLLNNGFVSSDLSITNVKTGEQFGESVNEDNKPKDKDAEKALNHSTIIDFLKHLFRFEGKQIDTASPYVADREGYILTVSTDDSEQKQVAVESLESHGAYYVKEM